VLTPAAVVAGTNFCLRARALGLVGWFPEYCITEVTATAAAAPAGSHLSVTDCMQWHGWKMETRRSCCAVTCAVLGLTVKVPMLHAVPRLLQLDCSSTSAEVLQSPTCSRRGCFVDGVAAGLRPVHGAEGSGLQRCLSGELVSGCVDE
jgi:hypothetical protein